MRTDRTGQQTNNSPGYESVVPPRHQLLFTFSDELLDEEPLQHALRRTSIRQPATEGTQSRVDSAPLLCTTPHASASTASPSRPHMSASHPLLIVSQPRSLRSQCRSWPPEVPWLATHAGSARQTESSDAVLRGRVIRWRLTLRRWVISSHDQGSGDIVAAARSWKGCQ